jgi:UDP-N-acetylmuramoyl-tripeptide--D-alanyl-D-alanine ligase
MLTTGHILAALSDYKLTGKEPTISRFTNDSREVIADGVFVAFVGEKTDGHAFVANAFARGAVAAIVEKVDPAFLAIDLRQDARSPQPSLPAAQGSSVQIVVENSERALQQVAHYWRQLHPVRVIGITGSVGKTTTKELIANVLSQRFRTLKSEKNFNTEIGLPLQLLNLRPEHERVVLEMGMYVKGDIALLASIAKPNVGIVTNVGTVHVERAGSQQAIAEGKRELVEALSADGVAILNDDDPLVRAMAEHTAARVLTYGLTARADLWASDIESIGWDGMRFALNYQGEKLHIQIPMMGRHSVQTALRAAAAGLVEGMAWEDIINGLTTHRDEMRLQVVSGPNGSRLIDDSYNASPQSMIAALNLLDDLDGRKIAVLGDMLELGSDELDGHIRVGLRSAEVADILITVGERGRLIAAAARDGGLTAVHHADSTDAAVEMITKLAQSADIILVKASYGARLTRIVKALIVGSDGA